MGQTDKQYTEIATTRLNRPWADSVKRVRYNKVVLQRIWVIGKTVNWCWVCLHYVICHLKILFIYMTLTLILCDYPCGKEVSDNVDSGKVQDSANGSS